MSNFTTYILLSGLAKSVRLIIVQKYSAQRLLLIKICRHAQRALDVNCLVLYISHKYCQTQCRNVEYCIVFHVIFGCEYIKTKHCKSSCL